LLSWLLKKKVRGLLLYSIIINLVLCPISWTLVLFVFR
jgi:hypothetical protein